MKKISIKTINQNQFINIYSGLTKTEHRTKFIITIMDRSCDDCRAWTELIHLLKENFDEQYYKFLVLDMPQNEGEKLIKKIAPKIEPAHHLTLSFVLENGVREDTSFLEYTEEKLSNYIQSPDGLINYITDFILKEN